MFGEGLHVVVMFERRNEPKEGIVFWRENSKCKGLGGRVSGVIENRPVVAGEWLELVHCSFPIIPLYLQAKVCEGDKGSRE